MMQTATTNGIAPERHAREFAFELPIGYLDADGRPHRSAVLRKMTGRDEAILADRHNRNNAARMITELLASCLLRLGTVERPGRAVVQTLYSGDRYFLLMKRVFTWFADRWRNHRSKQAEKPHSITQWFWKTEY